MVNDLLRVYAKQVWQIQIGKLWVSKVRGDGDIPADICLISLNLDAESIQTHEGI